MRIQTVQAGWGALAAAATGRTLEFIAVIAKGRQGR